jgi:hypothetical protein
MSAVFLSRPRTDDFILGQHHSPLLPLPANWR